MNKYLDNIESMETAGTKVHMQSPPDSAVVLQINSEPPTTTHAGSPDSIEDNIQELDSYSTPKKVTVRIYRLRK